MRFSTKPIFYLAIALFNVSIIVNGHANHDGYDHGIKQAHEHHARAEHPVAAFPDETMAISRVKRGIISKRDLFTTCTARHTACKQHVEQIYRNTPDYGSEKRKCDTEYNACIDETITNRQAFPINGQAGRTCAICQDDIKRTDVVFTSRCNSNHIFHSNCIKSYVKAGHTKCPLCGNRNIS